MRRAALIGLACAAALAAGCGDDDEPATPAACLSGPDAYVSALEDAPGEVTLDGTALGACLVEEQSAGQIASVGESMVAAARRLNDEAREEPLGEAPLELGYLVGVVERRAEETGGIHRDLALNVQAAATYLPQDDILPGGFQQRYDEGMTAGHESV